MMTPMQPLHYLYTNARCRGTGADTISIGMHTCLYYLATNPKTFVKLQADINEHYTRDSLSDEPPSPPQSRRIPFLKALRLPPSIVFQVLRYSPPEGTEIQDHYIPPATLLGSVPARRTETGPSTEMTPTSSGLFDDSTPPRHRNSQATS